LRQLIGILLLDSWHVFGSCEPVQALSVSVKMAIGQDENRGVRTDADE
jgi:hypothetical protein